MGFIYYHYSMVSCFFQLNLAVCMVSLPKQQSPAYVQREVRLPQGDLLCFSIVLPIFGNA